ncbi:hypothetical protein HI914_02241 [Erysiphe necator]|nr:hypothetical protein HI914_02241 [Erysiphe necator]
MTTYHTSYIMDQDSWATNLRNVSSLTDKIYILKNLKNSIIGNPLKKESVIAQGGLDLITQCIRKELGCSQNGRSVDQEFSTEHLNEEEFCRYQGLQIIASIAQEAPRFLASFTSASVFPALLSNICPQNNPPQLVLASLRALSNLADSSAMALNNQSLTSAHIADGLFSRQNVRYLSLIISQTSPSISIQTQISVASSLISKVCREERHQQILANSGVLDALASKLASFVVADRLVIPGAEIMAFIDNLGENFPLQAPPNADFVAILEAISVIISNSKLRCSQLIYSPSMLSIFPIFSRVDEMIDKLIRDRGEDSSWDICSLSGIGAHQAHLNWLNYTLPIMPHHQTKSSNQQYCAFPFLGPSPCRGESSLSGRLPSNKTKFPTSSWGDPSLLENESSQSTEKEEPESHLISYLILVIRLKTGLERLMAASILAALYRAGLTHKRREIDIGLLTIPLLLQMLDESTTRTKSVDYLEVEEVDKLDRTIKEMALAVLAMFIIDSDYLQKVVFDAGIISRLSIILKASYDPIFESANSVTWSPYPKEEDVNEACSAFLTSGHSADLVHKIKVREGSLKAIAALVPFKEEYRKKIVDQGLMPYIVESLSSQVSQSFLQFNEKSDKIHSDTQKNTIKGNCGKNPTNVLIAACGAVRALSRSVSVLRTTLIDNGVAEPVFRLLQHPDIEVQIAATATVINLLTDVSPMRDAIGKAGVLKILCEHARSVNPKLRLNAVWALKHLVQGVNNEMKRRCVEELGHSWLVQLICDDIEYLALHSKDKDQIPMPTFSEPDEDTEMEQFGDQIDSAFRTTEYRENINTDQPRYYQSKAFQQAETKLAALRDDELDPVRKARKDDVAVQEQGLDFIRNLISGVGHGTETSDMIDFLFRVLGQDRVFEILASKLRPKVINPYSKKISGSGESKVIPPQTEIIVAVEYILVHMAASVPHHRQLVIAQTELLKLLVPQFNHSSIEVRLALCWLITNLTWIDDQADRQQYTQRATELKKLGFLAKLEKLEQDPELSVRERAKSALWQMKQAY